MTSCMTGCHKLANVLPVQFLWIQSLYLARASAVAILRRVQGVQTHGESYNILAVHLSRCGPAQQLIIDVLISSSKFSDQRPDLPVSGCAVESMCLSVHSETFTFETHRHLVPSTNVQS